ncbi:MAG: methyltransferase domain-containing protein [Acetobacteraceae bacterium]|nr:methyltransferase domain-containing protein [Acetobacteraceae bacterium]
MPSVPDLSRLIPLSARVVLDVGCGRGDVGAAYRRLNPNARLLAIDNDPEMVIEARRHYDECVLAGAEAEILPFDVPKGVDCIVYSAILEHLASPFDVLRRHARLLAPNGTMLICVSNVEHWSLARRLLMGDFRYEDAGLMDRRHLRWFSLETMGTGLLEAGLVPIDVQPRIFDEPGGQAFVEAIAPALRNLGIDPANYVRNALPLQHVWRARREPVRRLIVAGDMLHPIGGVSHLRVLHPLAAMASDPEVVTNLAPPENPPEFTDPSEAKPDGADVPRIFILHRPALFGAGGQAVVDRLIDRGWLVVTEFDDHPDFMRGLDTPDLVSFRGVHAVQTTTPILAEVLRQRNPELALFPNAIASLPDIRNFTDPGVLTVFFGALNREQDWRPVMGPINAIAAHMGGRLRFRVVHDEGFFQALETRHKTFTPLCDYDTYLDLLGTSEISLMPLDDTPFNRAKSDLKFIEAGACRVASLASTVVYRHSIAEGETGLLFDGPDAFHRQFLRLAAIPDLALELGNNARRVVIRDRMLADQVAPRIAWYRDLWRRRDALTQALRARTADWPQFRERHD